MLLVGAFLTAFYMFRIVFLAFFGKEAGPDHLRQGYGGPPRLHAKADPADTHSRTDTRTTRPR
jgi:NADH:ubiquinone oxidoreductase subunit 5 (subunit L)/multisubunit Na+/H+ antiporter MnhA subunit